MKKFVFFLTVLIMWGMFGCETKQSPQEISDQAIEIGSKWQDIGQPTSDKNTYKIIKVEDGYVYEIDYLGTVRRVDKSTFLKACIEKQTNY